jgi:uncharacterized protein (TIGR02145 family)
MKKTLKICAVGGALLGGVLALSACGDDVTKVYRTTEENSGVEIAGSAEDFDDCDSASIGKMMFASDENAAYICADSGWTPLSEKASDGKDGTSCTVETLKDSTGYKIMCGEDSVGVILNGKTGAKGAKGEDGEAGAVGENGTSCAVEMLSDSTGYKVVCGEDSVGVILNGLDGNGCTLTDNGDGTLSQVCGETAVTLYKSLCGNTSYEPSKAFCYADSVYALCNETAYDPAKSFCYANSVYTLCGGKTYDPVKEFCSEDSLYSCGNKAYDPAKSFCYADSVYALCGGVAYDPVKEFCSEDSLYSCGNKAYDPSKSFCYADSLYSCGGVAYDPSKEFCDVRDFAVYGYVQIGVQTWMAENLNYDYNQNTAKSYCYNNSADSCAKYGRLYTWAAAMDSAAVFSNEGKGCGYGTTCTSTKADTVRGICPEGWHLPDSTEWKALATYVADNSSGGVGYALKSKSGWTEYDGKTGGSDAFGFGALPAGGRNTYSGTFENVLRYADFWGSSENSTNLAYYRYLGWTRTDLPAGNDIKSYARSVRCVKD